MPAWFVFLFNLFFGGLAAAIFVYCGHFARLHFRREGFGSNRAMLFFVFSLLGVKASVVLLFLAYTVYLEPMVLAIIK
jgi:hypothetical protein